MRAIAASTSMFGIGRGQALAQERLHDEPTSLSSDTTGGSSQRSRMPSWKRWNAGSDGSGLGPSPVSIAKCTKLTPSSSRNVA